MCPLIPSTPNLNRVCPPTQHLQHNHAQQHTTIRHPNTNNLIKRPPHTHTQIYQQILGALTYVFEPCSEPQVIPFSSYNSSRTSIRAPRMCHSKRTNTFINTNILPSRRQCSAQESHSIQHTPHWDLSSTSPSHHNDDSCPPSQTKTPRSRRFSQKA
jgi:hypothetical protein